MLLLICAGIIVVVGIICAIVSVCIDKFSSTWAPEWLEVLAGVCIIGGLIFGLVLVGIAGDVAVNKELNYQATLDTRAALIKGVEYVENADVNAAVSVDIFSDVAEFNAQLRKIKRWYDNPWLNIFFNDLIAENVDYIPLDGGA